MEWREALRTAETVEDFEPLKKYIVFLDKDVLRSINSPDVLRAYLAHLNLDSEMICRAFSAVSKSFRLDLLRVFFTDSFTPENININWLKKFKFRWMLANVIDNGCVDIMTYLLEDFGLDANATASLEKCGLLYHAVSSSKVDIMDLLLQKGADVNIILPSGDNLALTAMERPDVRILDRLIIHGLDLHYRDGRGKNLWDIAPFCFTDASLIPNFQRLADMGVVLDEATFENFLSFAGEQPKYRELLVIMEGVMKKQRREEQRREK